MIADLYTILKFWGKYHNNQVHPLAFHLLEVAAVGREILLREPGLQQWFARRFGCSRQAVIPLITFLLALHDLGKFSTCFQTREPEACEILGRPLDASMISAEEHHTYLGLRLWEEGLAGWLQELDLLDEGILENDCLRQAVFGHHGQPIRISYAERSLKTFFRQEEQQAAKECVRDLLRLLQPEIPAYDDDREKHYRQASFLLAGLMVLSDWIGSNNTYFPPQPNYSGNLHQYWQERALPQAAIAVESCGISIPPAAASQGFAGLFPRIATPSPVQRYADSMPLASGPQLVIIEDMTGSGKTEAALCAAHRLMSGGQAQGLFMALPTMATSNAMYARLSQACDRLFQENAHPSLILAHGARHLSEKFRASLRIAPSDNLPDEDGGAQCAAWLADNRKKALLAAVGVGTVDQALMAVLPARHQSLRLFGLARQVLVVDEVHAYDTYMHELLRRLLQFQAMLGRSAILLSATLPLKKRQELAEAFSQGLENAAIPELRETGYPLVTHVSAAGALEQPVAHRKGTERTVSVELLHDEQKLAQELVRAAKKGGCACWIRNTVFDVLRARELLAELHPADKIIVFHARFALGDRLRIEQEILDRFGKETAKERAGYIVLASQVIEQSLDVDFDLLATDLAPMDLLLQRFGRCQRHERLRPDGFETLRCLVLAPPVDSDPSATWYKSVFPKAAYVYPFHAQLWLTARKLDALGRIALPEQSRELIEYVYDGQAEVPQALEQHDENPEGEKYAHISAAWRNALDADLGYDAVQTGWTDDIHTPTRLGEARTTLRLARWENGLLRPWAEGRNGWNLSEVSLPAYLAKELAPTDPALSEALETLRGSLPDKGKYSLLLPLQRESDQLWSGLVADDKGKVRKWSYSPVLGFFQEEAD